jgi:hypothetical protein
MHAELLTCIPMCWGGARHGVSFEFEYLDTFKTILKNGLVRGDQAGSSDGKIRVKML